MKTATFRRRVLSYLAESPQPLGATDLADLLKMSSTARIRAYLRQLGKEGLLVRKGTQNRARWSVADLDLIVDEINNAKHSENEVIDTRLTERLVNFMADSGLPWKAKAMATKLKVDALALRNELLALESLGVTYRTGKTRGTRWYLG